MTWTKIGDEFPQEARVLTDGAFRTHVEALIWSSARMLDLQIPKDDLRRFADTAAELHDVIAELIAQGWWTDHGTHWDISHKWPEWQESSEQVLNRREKTRERVRTHRSKLPKVAKEPDPLTATPNPTRPDPGNSVSNSVTDPRDRYRPDWAQTQVRTQPRTLRDCCDDPALTSWANSTVCRNCGVRQSA